MVPVAGEGLTVYQEVTLGGSDDKEREYTINLPIYSCVHIVYIGIKEGSILKSAGDYEITKPIVVCFEKCEFDPVRDAALREFTDNPYIYSFVLN